MRIVGGKYRGKKIIPPLHEGTRPTSDRTRETLFNILLHNPLLGLMTLNNKTVLDVFAGTGALGLEAFSRGVQSVTFIENNRETLPTLYANIKSFQLPAACVLEQDARSLQENLGTPFELIFMDPPYRHDLILPALTHLKSKGWISKDAVILIELAKDESLELPPFLDMGVERISGAAKLLFCSVRA